MKKIISILLFCIMVSNTSTVNATGMQIPITMYFNGGFVNNVVQPFNEQNTTYVSLRTFIELFNIKDIIWSNQEQSIFMNYDNRSIKLWINQDKVCINGHNYILSEKPVLVDGNTMVPLDFIVENLGCDISWDKLTSSLFIEKKDINNEAAAGEGYTPEDVLWLSRIVEVEGRGTSYDCRLAIANVVLNRVKSTSFPSTVHDVIFQKDIYTQFPPAHKDGFSESTPSQESLLVAKNALNGENNIGDCLYFNNSPFKSKSNDLYKIISGEYFYH